MVTCNSAVQVVQPTICDAEYSVEAGVKSHEHVWVNVIISDHIWMKSVFKNWPFLIIYCTNYTYLIRTSHGTKFRPSQLVSEQWRHANASTVFEVWTVNCTVQWNPGNIENGMLLRQIWADMSISDNVVAWMIASDYWFCCGAGLWPFQFVHYKRQSPAWQTAPIFRWLWHRRAKFVSSLWWQATSKAFLAQYCWNSVSMVTRHRTKRLYRFWGRSEKVQLCMLCLDHTLSVMSIYVHNCILQLICTSDQFWSLWCRIPISSGIDEKANETEAEQRRRRLATAARQAALARKKHEISDEDWEWWLTTYPQDWHRYFEEFHHGMWWHMIQEAVGPSFTIGAVILYSDVTTISKNVKIWAVYGAFLAVMLITDHFSINFLWTVLIISDHCAASIGNLKNSRRHTNSGWKLVAIFPSINEDSGSYKDHGIEFKERKMGLFHQSCQIIIKSIQEAFFKPRQIQCSDGKIRNVKLVLAAWLGDREEHERICRMIGVRNDQI